ncbi:MAG: nicotinate (nicotinamide) nucleotide adenylyltransferase [Oscillospiraceae bacterium]|nr:nicotinate (nicotinamide) nucleotide adenylyltransferase [Oscillospiraceae bacterium]
MKIAFYGGSFNPPHAGHARCAQAAADFLLPDLFLIVPDYLPPHKLLAENSPSPEARLEMCRIAFRSVAAARVSDLELQRVGRSYTSDTIRELRLKYPDDELFLVIGSDMLFTFPEWHEYRFILSQCTLVVAARMVGESEELSRAVQRLREAERAKILLLSYEPYPASSTEIRKALAEGKSPAGLDEEVYRYIRENGYYLE